VSRAELRRLATAFLGGWVFGKGLVAAVRLRRRSTSGVLDLAPRLVVLSVEEEREMLEARVQWEIAAEELEERLPRAAGALRQLLAVQPVSRYRVREERDGGVLERAVAVPG